MSPVSHDSLASLQTLFSPRLLRFGVVGLSGVAVNLAGLWFFSDLLDLQDEYGLAFAIEISIIWNFFLNNAWTFQDRNQGAKKPLINRLLRYNLVSLVGMAIQMGTFALAKTFIQQQLDIEDIGIWKYAATCLGIGVATIWNFLSNFYWTWAQAPKQREANEQN